MSDVMVLKKKLSDELEVINKSLKGKKTIDAVCALSDIPTSNSKEDLFKLIKELYKFSKKARSQLTPDTGMSDNSGIEDMIKKQLTEVLPGLLQSALKDLTPKHNQDKLDTRKDTPPMTLHTLVIEKKGEDDDDRITDDVWKDVVKNDVKTKLKNVPVIKSASSNGAAKLHFKSKQLTKSTKRALLVYIIYKTVMV